MVVLVTGAGGQLGQSLQFIAADYPQIDFRFYGSQDLDITQKTQIEAIFKKINPEFCINAAAYTAVDKAESEPEKAFEINVTGARNVAEVCKEFGAKLIHISTDFVFDGSLDSAEMTKGYTEEAGTNPKSFYGKTKLEGEKAIQAIFDDYFIVRTSWVYSLFGNNFMKSMLRLSKERETLSIVNDQVGTPTNAVDLANVLIQIILHTVQNPELNTYGIYNFSNEGQCSWFDFAKKIFEVNKINIDLKPIPSRDYPTPAERPKYSVLDKNKIKRVFGVDIENWEESLLKADANITQ